MRAFLTSVPLLAIGLSIFSALTSVFFIPPDTFGSCFEGGCGYIALFVVVPITTLVILPLSWLLIKRLGDLTRILLWLPIVMLLGTVIWGAWFGFVIGPLVIVVVTVTTVRRHLASKAPLRILFLKTRANASQESA